MYSTTKMARKIDRDRDAKWAAVDEVLKRTVRNSHGLAVRERCRESPQRQSHGESDNDRVDADVNNQHTVDHSNDQSDSDGGRDGQGCRKSEMLHAHGGHDRAEAQRCTDTQIELPGDETDGDGARHDARNGYCQGDVDQIQLGQEVGGPNREKEDQPDQSNEDPIFNQQIA